MHMCVRLCVCVHKPLLASHERKRDPSQSGESWAFLQSWVALTWTPFVSELSDFLFKALSFTSHKKTWYLMGVNHPPFAAVSLNLPSSSLWVSFLFLFFWVNLMFSQELQVIVQIYNLIIAWTIALKLSTWKLFPVNKYRYILHKCTQ